MNENDLINAMEKVKKRIQKKYKDFSDEDREEIFSEACLGISYVLSKELDTKGFWCYFWKVVNFYIYNEVERIAERNKTYTIPCENCEKELQIKLNTDRTNFEDYIAEFSGICKNVLRMKFVEDMNNSEIARELEYSREHIGRIIKNALKEIKDLTFLN